MEPSLALAEVLDRGRRMHTIPISAKKDFLQQIATATGLRAVSELIWNGFDAGADRVDVVLVTNELGGLDEVRVIDNGSGIYRGHVESLFGNLGESWKREQPTLYGRLLHGRNGRGRFKGFAIGTRVDWRSCFESDGQRFAYTISGSLHALDALSYTDPVPSPQAHTGTEVVISDIRGSFGSLLADGAAVELAKVFGVYLSQYPDLRLFYHGTEVHPRQVLRSEESLRLPAVALAGGRAADVDLRIHEWDMSCKRAIHLCDASGHFLREIELGPSIRAPGHAFTVKACSDRFRELAGEGVLELGELSPDVAALLAPVREEVKAHFKKHQAGERDHWITEWLGEGSHPFADLPASSRQRQAFERLATHIEASGAGLRHLDPVGRIFNFHLLGTLLVHHPDGVMELVDELFPMKKDERGIFATLLA